jgi:hypothetical protein
MVAVSTVVASSDHSRPKAMVLIHCRSVPHRLTHLAASWSWPHGINDKMPNFASSTRQVDLGVFG